MFIGHYALALAAKRAAPRASLGALFAATSLADLLWPVFLLLGWEQAHIVPGPNPFLTLWLDSIPISHSLVTLIGWGALFGLVYRARTPDDRGRWLPSRSSGCSAGGGSWGGCGGGIDTGRALHDARTPRSTKQTLLQRGVVASCNASL